jgi:hypothetical protein
MLEFTDEYVNALRENVRYENGELLWNVTRGLAKANQPCGANYVDKQGYREMSFLGIKATLHRFVWIYHRGPYAGDIDHIDGDPSNCRIENLRKCTRSENLKNRGKFKNCSSKYKGVYFRKDTKKWQASIRLNGKTKHLGVYDTELAAHLAWLSAATEHHGEFLRRE